MRYLSYLVPFFFLLFTSSFAFPEFVARFPNGDANMREDSGITCDHLGHENCMPGAPRNPFGQDFDDNGQVWTKQLCEMDSDGDGLTNGEELGDPCCEWTADNPTPLRQDQLSHPGEVSDDAAKSAPGCIELSPEPSPEPFPSEDDDDGVCFPAHANVQLENGVMKRMDQLQVGDRVHIGRGKFSDIFLFTHKVPDVSHEFVTIRAGAENKLDASVTLTKGHYIYANGDIVTADRVKIGDMLELHDGTLSPVIQTECATFKGLYNPQTTHGDMIVDGVRVSTYTTAVQTGIAHSLLAPLRAVYRWFGWASKSFERGAPRLAKVLP